MFDTHTLIEVDVIISQRFCNVQSVHNVPVHLDILRMD